MPISLKTRNYLKKPLGILIPEEKVKRNLILELFDNDKYLVSVGDATTERILSFNITPDIAIIDMKERRAKKEITYAIDTIFKRKFRCENKAGTISKEAILTLKKAVECKEKSIIIVDGEEDLLALVAVEVVPLESLVVYGQPLKGMVIINVDVAMKSKAKDIINEIHEN